MENQLEYLKALFKQWSGYYPETIRAIPPSGSDRRYFHMEYKNKSAVGAWNPVKEENTAFLHFTKHFYENGCPVAAIYASDTEHDVYLVEDLGNTTLFSLLEAKDAGVLSPTELERYYRESLKHLVRFQVVAGKTLDYNICYPYAAFDNRSMKWDLNYFKYYFLKLHVPFHEGRLENDFETLVGLLNQADHGFFMYRDFQSRNIMIKDGSLYFIDYQGGRRGPLQYDVASLLFQVKAELPYNLREKLLDYYISELSSIIPVDRGAFKKYYYGFVLIRLLQVLGAYGFRGLIEKKPHFLASIPFALKNLRWWLDQADIGISMPELIPALRSLTELKQYQPVESVGNEGKLTVFLKSFSYRQGIPFDNSANGGGFVFDCRALPNPGREERYRAFNGKDQVVIDYLSEEPAVISFLDQTEKIVSLSVDNYLGRGFTRLSVNFGCTGGQHRSVYCTEVLAERLRRKYPQIAVEVKHLMINVEC
ncbi:MAG: phosphotransferase [Bacteroidales bacterium]|nr:phosphotransferase [Bacteroidales bacterium]